MASMRLRLTAHSLAGLQAPGDLREHGHRGTSYGRTALSQAAAELGVFCERVAALVGRPVPHQVMLPVTVPAFTGLNRSGPPRAAADGDVTVLPPAGDVRVLPPAGDVRALAVAGDSDGLEQGGGLVRVITAPHHPHLLWVHEHLQHLSSQARAITGPAAHLAEQRRVPWWR
jgi:hypothetical protein